MAQAIPLALMVASTAVQAGGQVSAANAQGKELRSEATQLDAAAGQDRASAQRAGAEQQRQSRLLQSRALARAAASGGGASDPTVVNLMANIAGEGEYRSLTALYEGEERARSQEMQANAKRQEARNVKKAGIIGAVGTVLSGATTMYGKYG